MVDTNVVSQIVQAAGGPVSWFYGLFGGAVGLAVLPIIKKAEQKWINNLFNQIKNGKSQFINNISDPDLKHIAQEVVDYVSKKGEPVIEKAVDNVVVAAETAINNPIATQVIEEAHQDIDSNLKQVVTTTTTTTPVAG